MEKLKRIIREYEEIGFEGLARGISSDVIQLESALTIIGPRRAGKTTYLREIIQTIGLKHFLFLNFEDERILQIQGIDPFLDAYYELYNEKPYIFIDEVQNAENWHLKVRRLIDQNFKVFITGSNANLLSSEIATHLAGRAFVKKIMPFHFQEFLKLKRIDFSQDAIYSKKRFQIIKNFDEFLRFGGFPEIIQTNLKRELLQQYFDIVFYKDMIVRHHIRQETGLRLIIQKLLENLGKSYKIANLKNRVAQLHPINKQTVFDYLRILQESFFVQHIKNFKKSFLQRETERKTYFIDNGFLNILSLDMNNGKLLENLVFLELLKRDKPVFYFRDKNECDFVCASKGTVTFAAQVTWELSHSNQEQEISGLLEVLNAYNLQSGFILTHSQEEDLDVQGKNIFVRPVWKWTLSEENFQNISN